LRPHFWRLNDPLRDRPVVQLTSGSLSRSHRNLAISAFVPVLRFSLAGAVLLAKGYPHSVSAYSVDSVLDDERRFHELNRLALVLRERFYAL